MATVTSAPVNVVAPDPEPSQFGLFSISPPVESEDRIGRGVMLESALCAIDSFVWRGPCDAVPSTPPKTGVPVSALTEWFPYQAYAMPDCTVLGLGEAELERRSRNVLRYSEEYSAEVALQDAIVASTPAVLTTSSVAIPVALSLLECWLAQNYIGRVGSIHMPRGMFNQMDENGTIARLDGTRYRTGVGNLLDFAGGFCSSLGPTGDPAVAGTVWVYATGRVLVWRAPVEYRGQLDRTTNAYAGLAERTYVVGFECGAAAAQVCLETC